MIKLDSTLIFPLKLDPGLMGQQIPPMRESEIRTSVEDVFLRQLVSELSELHAWLCGELDAEGRWSEEQEERFLEWQSAVLMALDVVNDRRADLEEWIQTKRASSPS